MCHGFGFGFGRVAHLVQEDGYTNPNPNPNPNLVQTLIRWNGGVSIVEFAANKPGGMHAPAESNPSPGPSQNPNPNTTPSPYRWPSPY